MPVSKVPFLILETSCPATLCQEIRWKSPKNICPPIQVDQTGNMTRYNKLILLYCKVLYCVVLTKSCRSESTNLPLSSLQPQKLRVSSEPLALSTIQLCYVISYPNIRQYLVAPVFKVFPTYHHNIRGYELLGNKNAVIIGITYKLVLWLFLYQGSPTSSPQPIWNWAV